MLPRSLLDGWRVLMGESTSFSGMCRSYGELDAPDPISPTPRVWRYGKGRGLKALVSEFHSFPAEQDSALFKLTETMGGSRLSQRKSIVRRPTKRDYCMGMTSTGGSHGNSDLTTRIHRYAWRGGGACRRSGYYSLAQKSIGANDQQQSEDRHFANCWAGKS
jgi:hypothetical protein